MITLKTRLSKTEKSQVQSLIFDIPDLFGDFYITKNNLRLFIKENINVLYDCLNKGDFIAFDEEGLVLVVGFSDNAPRKYLKVLSKNPENVAKYLQVICWNLKCDLYIKVKKTNPIRDVLLNNGFEFFGGRGKEVLLVHKGAK